MNLQDWSLLIGLANAYICIPIWKRQGQPQFASVLAILWLVFAFSDNSIKPAAALLAIAVSALRAYYIVQWIKENKL